MEMELATSNGSLSHTLAMAASEADILELPLEEIPADTHISPEIAANTHIFDEYFDINYAKSLAKFVLTPLEKYYFRAEFIGFAPESFPERNRPARPLILASNHSGMAFPWDGIIFGSGLLRLHAYEESKAARGIASPMLSKTRLMNPFLIPNFWKRAGGIDATTLNFETMMHYAATNILIYPEGVEGIGKGFDKRYQLQKLSTSALRMSIKYQTDIIPFATVNAEFINPFSYSIEAINELVQKLGIPFLPIGVTTFLVLFQPWMFYFAFPAKLTFVRGRRIKPYEMLDKPFEEITREDLNFLRNRIQSMMQRELEEAVKVYGQKPYDWQDLWHHFRDNWRKALYFLPVMWPFLFIEHERKWNLLQERLAKYTGNTPEIIAARQALIDEHMNQPESEAESLLDMVSTAVEMVVNNPQVLMLYVPVWGWLPTLWQGAKQ